MIQIVDMHSPTRGVVLQNVQSVWYIHTALLLEVMRLRILQLYSQVLGNM